MTQRRRVLGAPDKFRGTATATEAAAAVGRAAESAGWDCDQAAISDGGEGLVDCFGGANRSTEVHGPLGKLISAGWRIDGDRAVLEMAAASGLSLVGHNDPVRADTRGTGELIAAAIEAGARQIVVGAGGSASTDGGSAAVDVLRHLAPLDGSRGWVVTVAADVRTGFLDAATIFAAQKGATPRQITALTERLAQVATAYQDEFGVDVAALVGSGAAGGLAGGLAALGATIRPGFEVVAEQLSLLERVRAADLVITGEGRFDETSLLGKAVSELLSLAQRAGTPCRMIVGAVEAGMSLPVETVVLETQFGRQDAMTRTTSCIEAAAATVLGAVAD